METLKQFLTGKTGIERHTRLVEMNPSIGFRVSYDSVYSKLVVTVIGARHLPGKVNNVAVSGYFIKVTLFPTREKFFTSTKNESSPKYGEEFRFSLFKEFFTPAAFLVINSYVLGKDGRHEKAGTLTWPLLRDAFSINDGLILVTSDIWKEMTCTKEFAQKQNVASESKRLLVSLRYEENGIGNGTVTVLLSSLRLPVDIVRTLRKQKAEVHIKVGIHDGKTWIMSPLKRTFPPEISFHWNNFEYCIPMESVEYLDGEWYIRAVVSSKSQYFGKKTVIGFVQMTSTCEQWQKAIQEPDCSTKEWYGLLPNKI